MRELVEPLDIFMKHYGTVAQELTKECDTTWVKMHFERNQMILRKEDYFNHMFDLT